MHGTFFDPWIVPHHMEDGSFGSKMPLNLAKLNYEEIWMDSIDVDSNPPMQDDFDPFSSLTWIITLTSIPDSLDIVMSSNEDILEVVSIG